MVHYLITRFIYNWSANIILHFLMFCQWHCLWLQLSSLPFYDWIEWKSASLCLRSQSTRSGTGLFNLKKHYIFFLVWDGNDVALGLLSSDIITWAWSSETLWQISELHGFQFLHPFHLALVFSFHLFHPGQCAREPSSPLFNLFFWSMVLARCLKRSDHLFPLFPSFSSELRIRKLLTIREERLFMIFSLPLRNDQIADTVWSFNWPSLVQYQNERKKTLSDKGFHGTEAPVGSIDIFSFWHWTGAG